jgi:hypothetical protein
MSTVGRGKAGEREAPSCALDDRLATAADLVELELSLLICVSYGSNKPKRFLLRSSGKIQAKTPQEVKTTPSRNDLDLVEGLKTQEIL